MSVLHFKLVPAYLAIFMATAMLRVVYAAPDKPHVSDKSLKSGPTPTAPPKPKAATTPKAPGPANSQKNAKTPGNLPQGLSPSAAKPGVKKSKPGTMTSVPVKPTKRVVTKPGNMSHPEKQTPDGRARLFDPATLSLHVLPNGVRCVIKETNGTGLVSVQVWVRSGSRHETEANGGVSHLIETLAMRSSKNYPSAALGGIGGGAADAIGNLGGVAGSLTSRDSTFYSATVDANYLSAAVRALADAVLKPTLSNREIETAKAEAEEDLLRRADDPVFAASDLAYRAAFNKHPYRRPAGGTEASLEGLTGAAVRSYHKAHYVGANLSVVVVGDVQRGAVQQLVERHFSEASSAKPPPLRISAEKAPAAFKSVSGRLMRPGTLLALAFRSPGINAQEDVVAMDVLLAHWKEGADAVLRKVLLNGVDPNLMDEEDAAPDKEPLAQGFDVDFLTQRDPGLFLISLRVEPRHRGAAVRATLDEMARVRTNGIDAASLKRAKSLLKQQYIQQGETVSGQAGALGFYEMIATYEFAATYLDRISKVSAADVKAVANRYLSGTSYVQVTLETAPRPRPPRDDTGTITARAELPLHGSHQQPKL